MKPQYYYLVIAEGVEPFLHGPYGSEEALAKKVKAKHKTLRDEDCLVGMVFNKKGIPEVWSYSNGFFQGE
jgi:hypothetical protein